MQVEQKDKRIKKENGERPVEKVMRFQLCEESLRLQLFFGKIFGRIFEPGS